MIGRVNAGGGGSLQSTDAILRVIAPAGSTVTISKGGASKSDAGHENHDDATLYDYYFIIHQSQFDSINPWTVTATLGGSSLSQTIIIDSADEYDLVLFGSIYLYNAGVYTDLYQSSNVTTNGTITDAASYIELNGTTNGQKFAMYKRWANVPLTHYSTITLDITGKAPSQGDFESRIFCTQNPSITYAGDAELYNDYLAQASATWVNFVVTLDISALTGAWYVGVGTDSKNSAWSYVRQGRINSVLLS